MLLAIINRLPVTEFWIGFTNKNEVPCRFHLDTCLGINSENLRVHVWLITQCPDIVHSYDQFDNDNPFQPVILKDVLDLSS